LPWAPEAGGEGAKILNNLLILRKVTSNFARNPITVFQIFPNIVLHILNAVSVTSDAIGIGFGGGCEFGKNKYFLQMFGGDKEVRLS
jgi:hypothetical protein